MISQLNLKNFQAHRNTTLNLVDGLNVITGEGDQGKSAIIHSLYWLFHNRPSGDEFINWNSDYCSVEIVVDDKSVKREKGKNTNRYVINNQTFDAVRTDVPSEIKEIINISPTNIQLQDDQYFLLSLQPGEIARKLNQVVGIDQIDSSLKYVNSIVKKQNTEMNHIEEVIERQQKEIKKYKKLDYIERQHKKLNKKCTELDRIKSQINNITRFIDRSQKLLDKLTNEEKINDLQNHFDKLHELENQKNELKRKHSKLKTLQNKITSLQAQISNSEAILSKIDKHIDTISKKLEKAKEKQGKRKELIQKEDRLHWFINAISRQNKKIQETEKLIEENTKKLEEVKIELKICPFCETPFK